MTSSITAQADCTKGLVLRVSDILTALATEGIDVHRDAVVRASDKFLHVASRASERSHRQWSVDEVDLLVTAFRLRHDTGLTWPRIAEMFSGQRPLDVRLHDKIDSLRSDLENIIARVKATEDLLRDVKDGRSYAAAASETAAA